MTFKLRLIDAEMMQKKIYMNDARKFYNMPQNIKFDKKIEFNHHNYKSENEAKTFQTDKLMQICLKMMQKFEFTQCEAENVENCNQMMQNFELLFK